MKVTRILPFQLTLPTYSYGQQGLGEVTLNMSSWDSPVTTKEYPVTIGLWMV